jgi:hypothetical protein
LTIAQDDLISFVSSFEVKASCPSSAFFFPAELFHSIFLPFPWRQGKDNQIYSYEQPSTIWQLKISFSFSHIEAAEREGGSEVNSSNK